MDEYEANYSRVEEIINAAQSIKDHLTCRICLELFKEPVTIKCGHKFCRCCILRVASNDNATCPFCNIKIQKRSIPKEGNKQLELCVERFNALTLAINSDSGIDVLQPCNKVKSTKESAPIHDKPNTSKAGDTSFVSKKSVLLSQRSLQSKVGSQSKKRLSLRKKQTDTILRSSQEKNTLDKYLKSKSDDTPDEAAVTQEKVQSWLENITPLTADSASSDFNSEITSDIKTPTDDSKTKKSPYHCSLSKELKESDISPSFETSQSTGDSKESKVDSTEETNEKNEKTNCKETQMRIQEMEMNTRRKKSNHSLPDKPILKTPSVSAVSHSDAYNWRRVKRVGKEMQVKTFKSLNVSIEKNSSSIVLDDTVPCNSIINDSKNVSRRSDIDNSVSNEPSISKTKQKLSKAVKQKMESPEKITEECNYNQTTMDTSSLQNQNISLSSIDEKRVNEIIGIIPDNLKTPEKTRDVQNVLNHKSTENLHQLSPLKTNDDQVKDLSDDEPSNLGSKTLVSNNQSSPKRKLSLKKKLTESINSKSIRSQPGTPDRISQVANESPKNLSPDKPKSRLSLRLPTIKTSEHSLNQLRSPVKNQISESSSNQMMSPLKNQINSSESYNSSIRSVIVFKKLGRICRKRKHVPFLQLGKMIPKEVCKVDLSKIKIKSIEHTHIDLKSFLPSTDLSEISGTVPNIVTVDKNIKMLSPEKDSQLKFLSTESPHQIISKTSVYEADQLEVPMDIDESLPVVNRISKRQLDFQDVESNLNCDNDNLENENISKQEHQEPGPSKSNQETIIQKNMEDTAEEQEISSVIISGVASKDTAEEQKISSVITSEVAKAPNMPDISQLDFMENEKCINNNNFENLQSNQKLSIDEKVTDRIQEDMISISSINSESENIKNRDVEKSVDKKSTGLNINNKHTNSEVENDSDSDIYVPTVQKVIEEVKPSSKFEIVESSSSSSLSSLKTSPFKKKRSYSESSNDDDSVSSIIDKWCVKSEEPVIKKPKVITNAENNSSFRESKNKSKFSDDFLQDDDDNTLVNEVFEPPEVNEPQSDPPIDDIIKKVKSFREGEASASNLIAIPSSLMSADLFESNEPNMQHGVQTPSNNQITSDHSSVSTWSPNRKTNVEKENLNASPDYSNITMMDLIQFNNKKPSTLSESSDCSDKENNMSDQIPIKPTLAKTVDNTEDRVDVIETSQQEKPKVKSHTANEQSDPYHMSDSLMNITQEQLALKRIEKELIGVDLSTIQNSENNEVHPINEFSTPRRKRDNDFEVDSIDATPTAKRRQIYKFSSKTVAKSDMNTSQMLSPEQNISLIPAVTPMKNTKSYPLSHSTPMTNTQENNSGIQTKKINLICSGLCAEHVKIVQNFARKFGGTFQNNFDMNVTHVIVQTDPNTKAGQKTFKYIQGIAFKKYLVSFQWVTDCLKQNTLLNEDDEKYEVLDPEILEPGSKRSRTRTQDLFEGFAFFCLEPFSSFLLTDFQELLLHNGAMIVKTVKELSLQKEKLRIVILESENLSKNKVAMLKKSGVLVSFEWVVDSISQYQNLSLFPYLYATTTEEAAALGFPLEYLVDEETVDEEEEGEEG